MFYNHKNRTTNFPKNINFTIILFIAVSILANACQSSAPDLNGINVELKSERLDIDLYNIDTNAVGAALTTLEKKYPHFLNFYLDTLMGFGIHQNFTEDNPAISEGFRGFLTQKDYRGLLDTIRKHYPDVAHQNEQIEQGMRYMKYYFPSFHAPKVIYFSSGLNNWGAITYDTVLGIGLDMFLGKNYPFYQSVGIADYMYPKLRKAYIPVAAFRAIYQNLHPFDFENKTLLDMMVQRGQEQYFLSKILPDEAPEVRLGFTKAQLEWCESHEAQIFNFFVSQDLLYNKKLQKVMRYVTDGPSATGMPAQSPGEIGTWLGYQIIKRYADKQTDATLTDVLKPSSGQVILTKSGYKP